MYQYVSLPPGSIPEVTFPSLSEYTLAAPGHKLGRFAVVTTGSYTGIRVQRSTNAFHSSKEEEIAPRYSPSVNPVDR